MNSCQNNEIFKVKIYETAANGNKLTLVSQVKINDAESQIIIKPEIEFQKIYGFGGAFTEATAHLVNQLSADKRKKIIDAYFSAKGANYTLTRTHINSCDFSLSNYAYDSVANDIELQYFNIEEDMKDIIPMIKAAKSVSPDGFKIIASPWTAPTWMKDNKDWKGGKLLPEYYQTWALYFSKYINAYKEQGIEIWGVTVENEPLGNDNNWESMHYTPEEMNHFVEKFLGPQLKSSHPDVKILGYDQNRNDELIKWTNVMYYDSAASKYFDGIAIHWYASTYDYFPKALQYIHNKAKDKLIIQTEACIDAEIPHWRDDSWYWSKEATDWGFDWAPEDQKYLHPKYIPTYRYAQDIIGCLNNYVNGWIDWNMVLDTHGGPNWAQNWCIAPVIVNPDSNEFYITPLYYIMSHFSKFIRPGATRIGYENNDDGLNVTAAHNQDNSIAVIIFNPMDVKKSVKLVVENQELTFEISPMAIQSVIIEKQN